MRRLLALAVLVAFLPTANAQDKAKADFTAGAEYRARYFWMQNPGGNENAIGTNSFAEQRMKLGLGFKASEKLSAHMTALHAGTWGQETTETLGENNTGNDSFLTVNEAYANWMVSDDMSLRIGRQNFQIGDGYVMSVNDWEQVPLSFEGLVGTWEAEFGRLQAFAFKYRDRAGAVTTTHPTAGSSASKDPEHNAYGLNFDLKTTPEWLKAVNVHVIKDNGDAIVDATGTTVGSNTGMDTLRYGAHGAFAFGPADVKAWFARHQGDVKEIAAGGAKTEFDTEGMMYQLEAGFNLESLMGSRFYAGYHVDSGDDNNADGDAGTYDPYFTEVHESAGLMDILGWGNLTYWNVGWTLKPTESTTAGVAYYMFTRTESGAATNAINAGRFGGNFTAGDVTKDDLGSEIDLWAEHRYDGGLSTLLRLGYFTPGDYFDKATPSMGDNVLHVAVEGKLTF